MTAEQALDEVIDNTPVFPSADAIIDLGSAQEVHNFINDVAQRIHEPEVLAQRWGFPDACAMIEFIKNNSEIRRRIKLRRAIWDSDDNVQNRIREYAGHSLLEALPSTASMMFDSGSPAGVRIDATKLHARMAGVDGLPPLSKDNQGQSGPAFNLTINMPGRTEKITTVVDTAATQITSPEPNE